MIASILDTDLYKFSTSYAYMKLYPNAVGTFAFHDRDNTQYTDEFLAQLKLEFAKLGMLSLSTQEKCKADSVIRYIPTVYWEWLSGFHFLPTKINAWLDSEKHLHIEVTDLLYKVTLYEVPILAIVSELRNKFLGNNIVSMNDVVNRLDTKINIANEYKLKFSEFGTRRRFSYAVHEEIIKELKEKCPIYCVGTSNVHFALKYDMIPVGTFPHEWIMFHGAIFGYREANFLGMRDWVRVYDGDLGIFLMDTYTSKIGLNSMSLKYAKLFDGVRQDSGDEYQIGNMVIDHYKKLNIDPTTKTIVFSNALTFDKYKDIVEYFRGRIRVSAGIGTNLTNDCGFQPSNIVMKLKYVSLDENQPKRKCIKISDDLGKHMGDDQEFEIAKYQLGI